MVVELDPLEELRLARDVQVVRPRLHAGRHHRLAEEPVGSNTVDDQTCLQVDCNA